MLPRIDYFFELLLVKVNPLHDGDQVGPNVSQCWMIGGFHETLLKAGVEGHELMDEMCHLHELEVVFEGDIAYACILMLHAIASVLQGVEALVLNFPAQATYPTCADNVADIGG